MIFRSPQEGQRVGVCVLSVSNTSLVSLAARTPLDDLNMQNDDLIHQTAVLDITDLSPRFAEFTEESVSVFGQSDVELYVSATIYSNLQCLTVDFRVKCRKVKEMIMEHCDIPTLFAFYHDSKWREEAGVELNGRYEALLGRFTENVEGFREMMRKTNSVISGSAALWFLLSSPQEWIADDLDILVPESRFPEVVAFLTAMDGAVLERMMEPVVWPYPSEACMARAIIRTPKGNLDVLQSRRESALYPIPFYWSTHLMNALTADALYCAYPALTLASQGMYPTHTGEFVGPLSEAKHRNRGFTVHTRANEIWDGPDGSENCMGLSVCSRRQRYFGDDRTFVVPLGRGTIKSTVAWMAEMGTAAWRLGGEGCGNARCLRGETFAAGLLLFENVE